MTDVPTAARVARVEEVMGTVVSLDVRDPQVAPVVIDAALAWLHEVDARFSTYRDDTEIARLARGELAEQDCHQDVRHVLALCADVETMSWGAFDVRHPGARCGLDPSALVKGWSAERMAAILEAGGGRNFCINLGGDVVARGCARPGRPWRIGVRHPEDAGQLAAVLGLRDRAMATSGEYERGGHIVDARTGARAHGLLSMTVVGPSLTFADAYSTAAFAMGRDGVGWVASIDAYEALAITAELRVISTPGIQGMLAGED